MCCIQEETTKEMVSDIRNITSSYQGWARSYCGRPTQVLRAAHRRYDDLSTTYWITLQHA
ncbi:hypothetical protein WJ45_31860 [Burkholderia ubonensis]|nr:hypothetical protein WJ45_31860 [Burkholderia ubonensis]KVQ55025.1 hypothetical protein WK04_33100 [Burkholderia ubonensis]KWN06887.1 hypothetical protein WM21_01770 [Burkholderia ubonensis]